MIIAPQRVVTLHYELSDEQGQVLDDSRARGRPLEYLHGHANIMAGLERALEGREVGAELSVTLQPAEAYGQRDEALVQRLSRSAFPGEALSPGMRFQTPGEDGPEIVTLLEVHEESVLADTNHPLAGHTLSYRLSVLSVREARPEELTQGHPLASATPDAAP